MGVLEITLLRLKPGVKPTDTSLLKNLRDIRASLKTNSRFYLDKNDASNLFIFGLWPTMDAHHAFLASPERERILGPQEGQTEFIWGLHIGDIESMAALPLNATCLYLHRLESGTYREAALDHALASLVERLKAESEHSGTSVLSRERLDPASGQAERIIIHAVDGASELFTSAGTLSSNSRYWWRLSDLEKMDAS